MSADTRTNEVLLDAARNGDEGALAVLVERHRDRLERMVRLRMDRRLQGRVDPADVVQDAYLAVRGKFPPYSADPRLRVQGRKDQARKLRAAAERKPARRWITGEAATPGLRDTPTCRVRASSPPRSRRRIRPCCRLSIGRPTTARINSWVIAPSRTTRADFGAAQSQF